VARNERASGWNYFHPLALSFFRPGYERKGRAMATNRLDKTLRRAKNRWRHATDGRGAVAPAFAVRNVLAGVFKEIDDLTAAVTAREAKRRLPLAIRLQLQAAAVDCRLRAARTVIDIHEGLPESLPVQTEPSDHELMMDFLNELGPEAKNAYPVWLRRQLEQSRPNKGDGEAASDSPDRAGLQDVQTSVGRNRSQSR
jgi:hypothetical protein